MPDPTSRGTIQFSVDLVPGSFDSKSAQRRRYEQLIGDLVSLFDRYRLTASWAVTDPVAGPGVNGILASRGAHEIAALVDHAWIGDAAGRAGLLTGLQRRVIAAREQGVDVRSLALRHVTLDRDSDLLVRHGIVAIRDDLRRPDIKARPTPLRFGLWRIPVAMNVGTPTGQSWTGASGWRMRRMTTSFVRRKAAAHFGIDAWDCLEQGPTSIAAIERLLYHIRKLVDSGSVEVVTMGNLAERLGAPHAAAPSRSILRAA